MQKTIERAIYGASLGTSHIVPLNKGAIDCTEHNRRKITKKKEVVGFLVGHSAHAHAAHSTHASWRHS
jgi:hypothetical protein